MSKNILILDTGKEWGGGTNSLLELLKRIDKTKYHFTALFYNNYKKGADSDIRSEIEKLGMDFLLLEQKKQPPIAKITKELSRLIFFFSKKLKAYFVFLVDYQFRIKSNARKISKIIKDFQIDLLYMNNQPSSNLEGMVAGNIAGIPVIQHARANAALLPTEVEYTNHSLARMICVSDGLRDNYIRQGIQKDFVRVVHNGIDTTIAPMSSGEAIRKQLSIGQDEIFIGMVGSLLKRKGFDIIIRGLATVNERKGSFKAAIIGEGPEMKSLVHLAESLGLKNKITFTGFKPDALSYINAFDIFVLSSFEEGLPRVIIEAMLMGKPVVASDIPGVSELVKNGITGFLAQEKRHEKFADLIIKLMDNPLLRKQMGDSARRRVIENFSIEKYVKGVEDVFDEVLEH